MSKLVIQEGAIPHPILPNHISIESHFWDAFGNSETEVSAMWIVRLCQRKGAWDPFTEKEIEAIYGEAGYVNFRFNRLLRDGFVMKGDDNKYRVTHEFICRCFASSPHPSVFTERQPV